MTSTHEGESTGKTHTKTGHATGRGHRAARTATAKNTLRVELPVLGAVTLPSPEQLAYVGGIAPWPP